MKKRTKAKTPKKLSRKSTAGSELPDLVAVMTKFVERLETLEKKTDQILGRASSLPSEIRSLLQNVQRPAQQPPHPVLNSQMERSPREKVLYEAVCADCCKSCKVPFKPSEGRPVYCPECFAIRKAGHVPKDITSGIKIPNLPKPSMPALVQETSARKKKSKTSSKNAKKSKKKK
ncbi:MAG TPA: hypothetical protein PLO78_02630 [Candidatus Omnitrophota bacterium]|nr:hypothetical protein [Candidatus Omnitrophota bacterium]